MKHLIIGTAGHVDHGKTALIKALTNIDCDTHKQEKDRGITINLGFAHLNLPGGESVGIIDVPGHKDFIQTMVAGAFGIDIVMLVIAADSGIMPQTREHLNIIESLGISKGIVVITKSDLVDEEMLELAKMEIAEYLEGTVFEDAPIHGVSAITGQGISELADEVNTLVSQIEQRTGADFFRMYVDRLFNVKGIGFVVTGTVMDGRLKTGGEVMLLPGKNKKFKVKGLQRHGETVDQVYTGDRAALNLSGFKSEDFERGMLLSDRGLKETSMIDATITLFDNDQRIKTWSNVIFYSGTFECMARMHLLDKDILNPGETGIVQLHLEQPAILMNKDKFILRNTSNDLTYGGGIILDVSPLHHKKRTSSLVSNLQILADASSSSDSLVDLVKIELIKERMPMTVAEVASRLNKNNEEITGEFEKGATEGINIYRDNEQLILISIPCDREFQDKVLDEIRERHKKFPILETGLDTMELIGKLGFTGNNTGKVYTGLLMESIRAEGLVRDVRNTWVIADHKVKVDPKTKEQLGWLESKLQSFGMDRPLMKDMEAISLEQGINKDRLKMLLSYLGSQGKVFFFENDFVYTPVLDNVRTKLLKHLSDKPQGINEKQFRELISGTKKMAQVLLSIYINEGVVEKKTFYIHITEKGKSII